MFRLSLCAALLAAVCGLESAGARAAPPADQPPGKLDEKRFREIVEKWPTMTPEEQDKALKVILQDVPPKYHQLIKDYLAALAKARRDDPSALPGAIGAAVVGGVKEATPPRDGRIDEKTLRKFVDQWSADLPNRKPKTKEELLAEIPPKYRQMVKDYFEQLEKPNRDKK